MALSLITPEKLLRLYIGSTKQNLAYAGQVVQVLCMGKFFIYMFVDGIELADKLLWRLQTKLQRQRRNPGTSRPRAQPPPLARPLATKSLCNAATSLETDPPDAA